MVGQKIHDPEHSGDGQQTAVSQPNFGAFVLICREQYTAATGVMRHGSRAYTRPGIGTVNILAEVLPFTRALEDRDRGKGEADKRVNANEGGAIFQQLYLVPEVVLLEDERIEKEGAAEEEENAGQQKGR